MILFAVQSETKPFFARMAQLSLAVLGSAACVLGLSGCGVVSSGTTNVSQLRIIDATPDAGGIDIYAGSNVLTYNLGYGTVTSYIPINPGTYTLAADSSGTKTALSSVRATLLNGKQYTLLFSSAAASLQAQVLTDQSQPAPSGQIALRFLDEAIYPGALDLYLVPNGSTIDKVNPLLTNVNFGNTPTYVNVPTGTYTLYIVSAGTVVSTTTVPMYTGASTTYPSGSARTFVLLDQQILTTSSVQVVMANDYDSATATQ
ncbi:protein of unknown function [Terriglobus roseus]|uniref:DUF4397 domain-containing protein n=2 Tax=Terriglobus roseus TaxID=392734 RepID=A0A1G7MBY8_9BACT|nr:protein of unknown function [Terriglobus roseus]